MYNTDGRNQNPCGVGDKMGWSGQQGNGPHRGSSQHSDGREEPQCGRLHTWRLPETVRSPSPRGETGEDQRGAIGEVVPVTHDRYLASQWHELRITGILGSSCKALQGYSAQRRTAARIPNNDGRIPLKVPSRPVWSVPATSQRSRWQANLATTLVGCLLKRNRSYQLLHIKLLRCVLILCIIDITLPTREASTFSICCLRLSFCCLRCCVLRLKTRSLRPRSRSFRSCTVIRCSRSSTCFSSSCIS